LRPELSRRQAVETVWLLMDPAIFVRLTRHRRWSLEHYQDWIARSVRHLLLPDAPHPPSRPTRARATTRETA
jgi:hypothetical protein